MACFVSLFLQVLYKSDTEVWGFWTFSELTISDYFLLESLSTYTVSTYDHLVYLMYIILLVTFNPVSTSDRYTISTLNRYNCRTSSFSYKEVGGGYITVNVLIPACCHRIKFIQIRTTKHYNCHMLWYLLFLFWKFSSKLCNTDCIMPSFVNNSTPSIFRQFLKDE